MSKQEMPAMEENAKEGPKGVGRRSFIKGVGIAATATMIGGTATRVEGSPQSATATTPRTRGLAGAPVVMTWRQVKELSQSRDFINCTTRLPELCKDPDTVIYDGGNVLVGFTASHSNRELGPPRPAILTEPFSPQLDPTNTLVHVLTDFASARDRLKTLAKGHVVEVESEHLRFFDADGNAYSCLDPSHGGPATKARSSQIEAAVGAVELLVSDLDRSTEYYSEVLGLKVLSREDDETNFDLGTIVLTLRPERTALMVKFLNNTGRLLGAWQVFYVADIEGTVADLQSNGADFPLDIESLPVGRVAYLSDPDGHLWVLWQPSRAVAALPYHKKLSAILGK